MLGGFQEREAMHFFANIPQAWNARSGEQEHKVCQNIKFRGMTYNLPKWELFASISGYE